MYCRQDAYKTEHKILTYPARQLLPACEVYILLAPFHVKSFDTLLNYDYIHAVYWQKHKTLNINYGNFQTMRG